MKTTLPGGICALALTLSSCSVLPVVRGDPPQFAAPDPAVARGGERFPNWPLEPNELKPLVRSGLDLEEAEGAGGGTTGAEKVRAHVPGRQGHVSLKWKAMVPGSWFDVFPGVPGLLDGVNNSPRKEMAAWRLQQMFLDPEDYVVPETVATCVELDVARRLAPSIEPTLAGTRCVLGVLALWLQDVTVPGKLPDLERFRSDPVYAHFLSNLNLLTYLIKHHDGREGNFLIAKNDARPQVFAIDNGVAFGGPWFNWFVLNWSRLRVPAFRRESIDRLRVITEADLQDVLGVVAELRLDDDGIFRNVDLGPNLNKRKGVRLQGDLLQFGLTSSEIDDVWERIEDLVEDVDEDDFATF